MPNNRIDLEFADGSYTFALPLPQIDELQRKCGAASGQPSGIGKIFGRLLAGCIQLEGDVKIVPSLGEFYVMDIVETLRQGLIGGGIGEVDGGEVKVTPAIANRLIENYVLTRPLVDSWSMAVSILGACVMGYDPPKKDLPAEARATETMTAH
jgi:hypothetical protein